MKQKIKEALLLKINHLQSQGSWDGIDIPEFSVERPKDYTHGDYTVNLGFILAKALDRSPVEIGNEIVSELNIKDIQEINVIGGYINFTVTDKHRATILERILREGQRYGSTQLFDQQRVIVEHTSPNLFKPFHIGHLVNNTVGESIVRMVQAAGGDVVTLSYPSDMSLGIAKAVWAASDARDTLLDDTKSVYEKMQFLGECYVRGTASYDADTEAQKEIRTINQSIYAGEKNDLTQLYIVGKDLSLTYLKEMTASLGSTFDNFIFESEAGEVGRKIVQENTGEVFESSEGAIIYRGEQEGLHSRVFLNSEGLPTYEAKDIGLLALKFAQYTPDQSVIVTDMEQGEYYKVVLAAAGKINNDWQSKTRHITHGRLQFSGMKISSRLGNVPLAEDVIETVTKKIHQKANESEHTREITDETISAVAIGAIKFAILKVSLGKNIIFDAAEALSFEGDSGPYLQYTYARTVSLSLKAEQKGISADTRYLEDMQETVYILGLFPEILETSVVECSPHHLAGYLLQLAHAYNSYYSARKILDESSDHSNARLGLTIAVGHTIKNGLNILGIDVPDTM